MSFFSLSTLLALVFLQTVKANYMYQFVVYANNTPPGALDAITNDADQIMAAFFETKPTYDKYYAGESISTYSYPTTTTETTTTTTNNNYRQLAEGEDKPALRGASQSSQQRELQAGGQCPQSCKFSGSQYCRSIGCANWGNRRLLKEVERALATDTSALSYTEKVYIESNMNQDLSSYCNGAANCKIWARILKVNSDGTTTANFY